MSTLEKVRLDKWMWAVRLYKTRALATEACRKGQVKSDGKILKPSHEVRVGEILDVRVGGIHRIVKVRNLILQRVSPALVSDNLEDLTPDSEWEKLKLRRMAPLFPRSKGSGRPTKKDRREMDSLL